MMNRLLTLTAVFMMATLAAFGQTISGRVTAAQDNSPVPGASVLLKGTTTGTTTDADGKYSISINNVSNPVLVFSFIGFKTQEFSVSGSTVIDITLQEDLQQLNEVVVTALGISREKKSLGYAVSTVTADQITASGNTNFASALYGKAAGVKIMTAPGGATSAVNVQIRGVNSLNYSTPPLYVVDGILIRDMEQTGSTGLNNGGYWGDQKIRGNGILDINPADIESLTVLKGAAASALYGSKAAGGVIVITTKKGSKAKGLGVDVNYSYLTEKVAFTPKFQNVYGPGYDRDTNLANGANEDGFIPVDLDGDGTNESLRPYFRAYGQFGPKMDGRPVAWWDGTTKSYSARPDNYKDFYQTGHSSSFNVALANTTDRATYRLSYTNLDYVGIARGGDLKRNSFNLNSSLKLNDKVSTDIVVNYVNSKVTNRPEQINRLTANYGGFFSRTDDMQSYLDGFQTSEGYKYVPYNLPSRNPEEAQKYNIRAFDLLDYFWRNIKNQEVENQDRLITSITLNYQVLKDLRFRGRVGNDFTSLNIENKQYNEYPITFNPANSSTGNYSMSNGRYATFYTDFLLSYNKKVSENFDFGVSGGFQSRSEKYRDQYSATRDGLVVENWFSLRNSKNQPRIPEESNVSRGEALQYAYLGIVNLSFKNYLFLEGTARKEYSSALPPGNNDYFYASGSLGFVFTDAFELPSFLNYGKLRVSQATAGNAPPRYEANIVYNQTSLQTSGGPVPSLSAQNSYGNNYIQPEFKIETEFGLETKLFDNKLGLDLTYYTNKIKDQLMRTSLAPSTGASSVLTNIGELRSHGIEIALNATPISTGALRWDTRFNFAVSKTKVHELSNGMDEIIYYNADAGAVQIKAEEGELIGNIYAHPRETDASGNFVIDANGLYVLSQDYKKVGNVLPNAIGGFSNTISYKGFALDFMIDYRFGGKLVSAPLLYGIGAGMYEGTLKYRDEEHGGLPYYIDASNKKIALPSHTSAAPDGSKVYHDGIVLPGVTTTGEQNETIIDAPNYYLNTYTWAYGWYEDGAVFKNDYIKMREVVLSYNLPQSIADKLHFNRIRVSLIGRNLFYLYRTLDHLDPEVAIGTRWDRLGVDEGSMAANRSYGISLNASF